MRSVDIATKLGVSKASVNKAVSLLKEKGLAEQPYYGDITLTDEGYEYGVSVLDRHHMLFTFLTKALGVPDEQAEKEACLMEHAISDDSYKNGVLILRNSICKGVRAAFARPFFRGYQGVQQIGDRPFRAVAFGGSSGCGVVSLQQLSH